MNAFGWICLTISTIDVGFINIPVILMGNAIIAIVYYEQLEFACDLGKEIWQIEKEIVRYGFRFGKYLFECGPHFYRRLMDTIDAWKSGNWQINSHFDSQLPNRELDDSNFFAHVAVRAETN